MEGTMVKTKPAFTLRTLLSMVLVVFGVPLLPMIISAQWRWWEAWIYALLNIIGFLASRVWAGRRHPDILEERARSMQLAGAKAWDRILAPGLVIGNIFLLIVAGLDRLFEWSPSFSLPVKIFAILVLVLGYALGAWAMAENRFFAGVVLIQKERGHQVVSTGPYRFLRHPGYAGLLWTYPVIPLLLDSRWAFLPALLLIGMVVVRTLLEDEALQQELPGYQEYAANTPYRLLPGIW
jgi:protein-S-isoprenylcysteine O-methyltransferase Ste14